MSWIPTNISTGVEYPEIDDETKAYYEKSFKGKYRFRKVKSKEDAPAPKEAKKVELTSLTDVK